MENLLAAPHWDFKWVWLQEVSDELVGVNSMTVSVMNIDGERLGAGVNIIDAPAELRAEWRFFLEVARDAHGISPIIYLQEWEHNPTWKWNGEKETWVIDKAGKLSLEQKLIVVRRALEIVPAAEAALGAPSVPPILVLGEEYDDSLDDARTVASEIRKRRGDVLIGIHNPHTGAPRERCLEVARELRRRGLLDVFLFQGSQGELEAFVAEWDGPVIAHEVKGGFEPNELDRMVGWASVPGLAGFSVYTESDACSDQLCRNPGAFAGLYPRLVEIGRERARGCVIGAVPCEGLADVNQDGRVDAADLR